MGLGLLYLISKGSENKYFTYKPNITFFKKMYKKHTNFSIETINQFFKTTPDFGRKVSVIVSKNADLIGPVYLNVMLPSIPKSSNTFKKFRWVDKIGLALIKSIDIEIGGILINRLYSDWMNIWNELTLKEGNMRGYNNMIGNIDILKQFSNGKESYNLIIPINFWFMKESGLFLPITALHYHNVKIDVEFNSFEKCFIESPNKYITINEDFVLFDDNEKIIQNVNGILNIGEFIYFDTYNKRLYYKQEKGTFETNSNYNIVGENTNYSVSIQSNTIVVTDNYYNNIVPSLSNCYLMINYVYLDKKERNYFKNTEHKYLIPLVENITTRSISNNNFSYKLNIKNPVKLLVWRCILKDNINNNNMFEYSMYPIENTNIIEKIKLIINSVERTEVDDYQYYMLLENFKSKFNSTDNIYTYSFALDPKEYQPSGTMNFSKVDDAYLQLTLNKNINYQTQAEISGYSYHYNILRIKNGYGGLEYYN